MIKHLPAEIAAKIAEAIRRGDYELGKQLPAEHELADQFKVSRPTVREALAQLQASGVTATEQPQSDWRALEGGAAGACPFQILEMHRIVEGNAAELAAVRMSPEEILRLTQLIRRNDADGDIDVAFHIGIACGAGNNLILDAVSRLWAARSAATLMRANDANRSMVFDLRRKIAGAIGDRDGEVACKLMQDLFDQLASVLTIMHERGEVVPWAPRQAVNKAWRHGARHSYRRRRRP